MIFHQVGNLGGRHLRCWITPGLRMAPFYVFTETTVFGHPDWWVLGPDGVPISYGNLGSNSYVIIDEPGCR